MVPPVLDPGGGGGGQLVLLLPVLRDVELARVPAGVIVYISCCKNAIKIMKCYINMLYIRNLLVFGRRFLFRVLPVAGESCRAAGFTVEDAGIEARTVVWSLFHLATTQYCMNANNGDLNKKLLGHPENIILHCDIRCTVYTEV